MMKCCFCGWEIPEGKGNDPVPASMEEGTVCCNWCNQHVVIPARELVTKFVLEMSSCTIAEEEKRNAERAAIND